MFSSLALHRRMALTVLCVAFATARPAQAAVLYSGLKDLAISTTFEGLYLDIDTGATGSVEFTGWDINPFFGGVGVANSSAFQAARIGTGNTDAILRLNVGDAINAARLYSSGEGGSATHLGSGSTQFGIGQEGYLGFKFTTNANAGPAYGWLRVVFTANTGGAVIKDWAYENGGGTVVAGRVQQSAAAAGVQLTTVSPGSNESFTLGSAVTNPGSGNVGALLKTGAGTTILNTNQNFTGTTTVSGGALELATGGQLSGSSALVVNTGGTLLLSGTGGTNSKLRTTATTDLHGGTLALTGLTSHLDQQLGTLTLSENSTLDFGTFAAGQTLRFADSSASLWTSGKTLSIWNWSQGTDHLSFGTSNLGLTSTQLSSLRFYSDSGSTLIPGGAFAGSSGTFGEVSPIPEPSSLPIASALLSLIALRERRSRKRSSIDRQLIGRAPVPQKPSNNVVDRRSISS